MILHFVRMTISWLWMSSIVNMGPTWVRWALLYSLSCLSAIGKRRKMALCKILGSGSEGPHLFWCYLATSCPSLTVLLLFCLLRIKQPRPEKTHSFSVHCRFLESCFVLQMISQWFMFIFPKSLLLLLYLSPQMCFVCFVNSPKCCHSNDYWKTLFRWLIFIDDTETTLF